MSKEKLIFICQSCGYETPHWLGQCPGCSGWNTLVESISDSKSVYSYSSGKNNILLPIKLNSIKNIETKRVSTKMVEFDRVLGGGLVPGQVILIAGTPGIGKSTMLTQLAMNIVGEVLYICGEESANQVKIRADRMKYKGDNLLLLGETNVENICAVIEKEKDLGLIIVDSIQSLFSGDLTGMAGSIGQIRGSTYKIIDTVKRLNLPVILVGHVTKEGTVAGPKVLEHMVDTVLYLEGDSNHLYRILKTTKNRFGPVSEVGIFEMGGAGMIEVSNPSKLFLDSEANKPSGTCVTVVMEGFRPMLFEIQALTVRTSFGYPKRTANGYNINRLHVLIATVEKRLELNLSDQDVYLSVSGGYKITEYSCDLAVCLAIISSLKDKPLKVDSVAFGECDLSGRVRRVPYQDARIKEAKKLGYSHIISAESAKTLEGAVKIAF